MNDLSVGAFKSVICFYKSRKKRSKMAEKYLLHSFIILKGILFNSIGYRHILITLSQNVKCLLSQIFCLLIFRANLKWISLESNIFNA